MNIEVGKMKKALLVGNGFTSQIIPDYLSSALLSKVRLLIPNEMKKIENIFIPFRTISTETGLYYYRPLPTVEDDEDCFVNNYVPAYIDETFLHRLRTEICRILIEKCNINNPNKLCQRLFY